MFSGHTYALRGLVYREPKRLDIIANSGTRMRRIFHRHIFRLAPVQLRAAKYRLKGPHLRPFPQHHIVARELHAMNGIGELR